MNMQDKEDFLNWLAEEVVTEDDANILVSRVAHRLVDLGYLDVVDIVDLGLCGCM